MPEIVIAIFGPIIVIGWLIVYYRDWNYIWKTVDGVSSIDGITYLIKDTDVNYVMYKLSSVDSSNMIKWHFFIKENDNEGILKFGGMAYGLRSYLGDDMNAGLPYRIKCVQKDCDVILKISYEGGRVRWYGKTAFTIMNQAYHRFFKEQFDVQIIPKTEVEQIESRKIRREVGEEGMANQYEVTWKIHLSWFLEKMLATREIVLRIIRCAILPFALCWVLQLAGRSFYLFLFCTLAICSWIYSAFRRSFQRIKDIKAQYRNKVIFYETENWIQKVVFQEDDIVLTEGNVTVRFTYSNIENIRDKGNKVWITFHDKTVIRLYKDAFIDSDWEACKSKLRTSCFYA